MSKKDRGNEPTKGSLADQLKNLGLLSDKQARSIEREGRHEKRREQKEGGPTDEERRREAFAQTRELEAEKNRERAVVERTAADRDRWREVVKKGQVTAGGNRRFYFVDRDRSIPFVETADAVLRDLQRGEAAIVETQGAVADAFAIVAGRAAIDELARLDEPAIRYWNGASPPKRMPSG